MFLLNAIHHDWKNYYGNAKIDRVITGNVRDVEYYEYFKDPIGLYVYQCHFYNVKYAFDIHPYNTEETNILCEECSIEICKGFISGDAGNLVLKRICGNNLETLVTYHGGEKEIRNILECSAQNDIADTFIFINNGIVRMEHNNCSYFRTCRSIFDIKTGISAKFISYCNLVENLMRDEMIKFESEGTFVVNNCNFIGNKDHYFDSGKIFIVSASIDFNNCFFVNNKARPTWEINTPESGQSKFTLTFSNCYLNEAPDSTQCTLIIKTPIQTPSKNEITFDLGFCQSCKTNWFTIKVDPLQYSTYSSSGTMRLSGIVNSMNGFFIYYLIDEQFIQNLPYQDVQAGITTYPFSNDITLPQLSKGSHRIKIWGERTINSKFSQSYHVTTTIPEFVFGVECYPPSLTVQSLSGTYNKQTDTVIKVSGTVQDPDRMGPIQIWYKYDDQLSESKLCDVQITDANPKSFSGNANIPSALNVGSHTLIIWAVDNYGLPSERKSLSFYLDSPIPSITVNAINPIYYRMQSITISGKVSHPDLSGYIIIYYRFGSSGQTELTRVTISSSQQYSYTKTFTLPTSLTKGTQTITVWAVDSRGKSSKSNPSLSFQYDYNTPVLNVNAIKSKYIRKIDSVISITGTVSDADQIGPIIIWGKIDQQSGVKITEIQINDASGKSFSGTFSIPPTLSATSHTLSIWAVDNYNKQTDPKILTFTFEYNKPILNLNQIQNRVYLRVIDATLQVRGSVSDADAAGYVTIKNKIDSGSEIDLQRIDITSSGQFSISKDITLNNSLARGPHSISFRAVDNDGLSTSSQSFPFSYEYNKPSINLNALKTNPYMRTTDKIVISGNVVDQDGFGTVTITYKFDNRNDNNLINLEIKSRNSHSFSKEVAIPSDLSESKHTITIKCFDNDNMNADPQVLEFNYKYHDPVLEITMSNNIAYTRNSNDIIRISGSVYDLDSLGQVFVKYKIDGGSYTTFQTFFITTANKYTISHDLKLSSSLAEGSHHITIVAIDNDNHESMELLFDFTYSYSAPILSVNAITDITYTRRTDSSIAISGSVKDVDCQGTIYVKYKFDNLADQLLKTITLNSCNSVSFSETVTIPDQLSEDRHKIIIFCVDETNKQSQQFPFSFSFAYNRPVLRIDTINQNTFTKSVDKFIHITGDVSDADDIGTVQIYIKIDNFDNVVFREYTSSIAKGNKIAYDFVFPQDFKEGSHTFKIWAEDNDSKKSEFVYTKNFNYKFNDPKISLNKLASTRYKESNPLKIGISGKVSHIDGNPKVTLRYIFDSRSPKDVKTMKIPYNSTVNFDETISIIDAPRHSSHTLFLDVCDSYNHCHQSNEVKFSIVMTNTKGFIRLIFGINIIKCSGIFIMRPSS